MINRDEINSLWDSAPEVENTRMGVPDGKYIAIVHSVRLEETPKGTPYINWDLIINDGEYANRHVFNAMFITPNTAKYAKATFTKIGFGGISFNDFETVVFPQLIDGCVDILLKTGKPNGDYEAKQNVYINSFTKAIDTVDEDLPF